MEKKLQRDENSKMIGGVCAGLAEYFDVDVTWVRLAFILSSFTGAGGIAYIVLLIVVPVKPFNPFGKPVNSAVDYRVYENAGTADSAPFAKPDFAPFYQQKIKKENNGRLIVGGVLIVVGLIFLFRQFDLLPDWFAWRRLWPLSMIVPGALLLLKAGDNKKPMPDFNTSSAKTEEKEDLNLTDHNQKTEV